MKKQVIIGLVGFIGLGFTLLIVVTIGMYGAFKNLYLESNSEIQALKQKLQEKDEHIKALEDKLHSTYEKVISLQEENRKYQKEIHTLRERASISSRSASREWRTFRASFYNIHGGDGRGITASGRRVQDGVTVAVDPEVIPLGTWIEVKYPDGRIERRRADDTGGAIKGHRLDIYVDAPTKKLYEMGVQKVQVRIID